MSANRIPLSVRIDQEEADFIAQLSIEGASTPSEKIRELLKQARRPNTASSMRKKSWACIPPSSRGCSNCCPT